MSDVMTTQLVQSLKGYFKKEEFSDKILHIIEIDDVMKSEGTNKKRKIDSPGKNTPGVSPKKSKVSLSQDSGVSSDESPTIPPTPFLSSTPISPRRLKINSINSESPSGSRIASVTERGNQTPNDNPVINDSCKVFDGLAFSVLRHVSTPVCEEIRNNGGAIFSTTKNCDYIITAYANNNKKKSDTRERTVKWVHDCIKDKEVKASFLDVMYRPVQLKSKPLSGCIISFDQFDKEEKESLIKLVDCLGASWQEMVFAKHKNNSMTASTHLIMQKNEGLQYDTAKTWGITCISKEWILKCIETQSKYPEQEFLINNGGIDVNSNLISSNESGAMTTYSTFPVHSLILCINSPYFKTLISDSGMKETKQRDIIVKVNAGEGKYLELLINSFYDQDILKDMDPLDLLKVLEIADRYLCDVFIKRGLVLLKKLNIKSVSQCNLILEHILMFESLGSLSTSETYTSMKQFCSRFLADLFLPLESKIEKHELFETMTFDTLMLLLKSGRQFLWNENSVIYFVVNWLAYDSERQTEENIKLILSECRYEQMTPEFLRDVLSPNHTILSKWKDYIKWYIDALSFHALSPKSRKLRDFPPARKNRSLNCTKTDIQHCMIKLSYVDGGMFKQSWVNYRNIVFHGHVLTPAIIVTQTDENDSYGVKLHLYLGSSCHEKVMEKFYLAFDIAFAILPGDNKYETDSLFCHSSSSFIAQHYRPLKIKFDTKNLAKKSVGTIDSKLYSKFREHGMCVSVGFKAADVSAWPQFMKSFHSLMHAGAMHRKSTDQFGQYDLY